MLEGCVLAVISKGEVYGYELSEKLKEFGLEDVSEGSIYPILLRLQKANLIQGEIRSSPSGPKRKYYTLTKNGQHALLQFINEWESLKKPVDSLLKKGE